MLEVLKAFSELCILILSINVELEDPWREDIASYTCLTWLQTSDPGHWVTGQLLSCAARHVTRRLHADSRLPHLHTRY